MTVLTNRPQQYWYALGAIVHVLIFASLISAQIHSQLHAVVGIHHEAAESEDSCTSSASIAVGPSSQTETQPKPHVPISTVMKVVDASVSEKRAADTTLSEPHFEPIKELELEKVNDPFKPWEHPKAPSRFLKPEADDDSSQNGVSEKFHWKRAVLETLMIQTVQHAYAIAVQERMRRELKGPFLKDWLRSVKNLHGWDDGNKFFTNYIAHPMQGGMTGFIYLQNHDRLKRQTFAESKTYWVDRLKAMAWSAAWSTQWEIGPYSQASIGNVGLKKGMAYVDLVVTPTVGTGWMITEEALDRFIIRHIESKNFVIKIFARTLLNPMRGVANALRFREPWYRDRPPGH